MNKKLYSTIDILEASGLVKAIYTHKEWNNWPCNELDNTAGYDELTEVFGVSKTNMVRIPQVHSSIVRVIKEENLGEGITKLQEEGYDGMVTDIRGAVLCTVEADCVPVYILDPVKKAIGMVHSGWKGTAAKIGPKAVKLMQETYGTNPSDLIVCFGPCICGDCYEVSDDLIPPFLEAYSKEEVGSFFQAKENGKYNLNLTKAIGISLMEAGVKEGNIHKSPACTLEDESLCSWRRDADKKARMLTAILLNND